MTADAEEEDDGEQADADTKDKNAVAFAKRSVYIIKSEDGLRSKKTLGYYGLAMSERHAQALEERLRMAALRYMCEEGSPAYNPKCAEAFGVGPAARAAPKAAPKAGTPKATVAPKAPGGGPPMTTGGGKGGKGQRKKGNGGPAAGAAAARRRAGTFPTRRATPPREFAC